jgi:hypothetical protein
MVLTGPARRVERAYLEAEATTEGRGQNGEKVQIWNLIPPAKNFALVHIIGKQSSTLT